MTMPIIHILIRDSIRDKLKNLIVFLPNRGLSGRFPLVTISNLLIILLHPLYIFAAKVLAKSNIKLAFCYLPHSVGHVAAEYYNCISANPSNSRVIFVVPSTSISKDFASIFNSFYVKTGVRIHSSTISFILLLPILSISSRYDVYIETHLSHAHVSSVPPEKISFFPGFSFFLLSRCIHNNSDYETLICSYRIQALLRKEFLAKLSSYLRHQVSLFELSHGFPAIQDNPQTIVLHRKAVPGNATPAVYPESSFEQLVSEILDRGLNVFHFCNKTEYLSTIDVRCRTTYSESVNKRVTFRDQIIIASKSRLALINASGLENLFLLFNIPVIYYGSWHIGWYAPNPQAIDIPCNVFSSQSNEFLDPDELEQLLTGYSYEWSTVPPTFTVSLPSTASILNVVFHFLEPSSSPLHPSLTDHTCYSLIRKQLGRKLLISSYDHAH